MDAEKIVAAWMSTKSVRQASLEAEVSAKTVVKVLVSNGILPTQRAQEIAHMAEAMPVEEIAAALGTTVKNIKNYLPYTKGSYLGDDKTVNAVRIRECRERKQKHRS